MSKDFTPYPQRQIRLSDEVWLELKREKDKIGGTWNTFIKSLEDKSPRKNK